MAQAQTAAPPPGISEGARLSSQASMGGGGKAGGPLVNEHGQATMPDAGVMRSFFGSIHGHSFVSGVFTASAIANHVNPTAAGGVGGFAFNKKIGSLFSGSKR